MVCLCVVGEVRHLCLGRWGPWLRALPVRGNSRRDGADQGLQGDALGTIVGTCCFIRSRHAAHSASSCFEGGHTYL